MQPHYSTASAPIGSATAVPPGTLTVPCVPLNVGARLVRASAVPAHIPDIHPNIAIVDRRKVERIVLTPGVRRGEMRAAFHGDLGTILE